MHDQPNSKRLLCTISASLQDHPAEAGTWQMSGSLLRSAKYILCQLSRGNTDRIQSLIANSAYKDGNPSAIHCCTPASELTPSAIKFSPTLDTFGSYLAVIVRHCEPAEQAGTSWVWQSRVLTHTMHREPGNECSFLLLQQADGELNKVKKPDQQTLLRHSLGEINSQVTEYKNYTEVSH